MWKLLFEPTLPSCVIVSDRNRLNQVIANFVNNAIKFTTAGSIRVGYDKVDETHLRFYVADTGLGIEPEMQAQIFDRFIKLNTFVHGTGLGLSISKSIIEQLGGTIGVDSEPGKGSCFLVCAADCIVWKCAKIPPQIMQINTSQSS